MADTDYPQSKLFQRLVPNALAFSFVLLSAFSLAQDGYEDNDTLETATLLVVGDPTPQSHTLDPDQDVDWFRFNAQFFEVYDIKTVDVGSTVDLVFEVYDESGELIGEPVDDFLSGIGEETSFRAPSTGTFYIKVYDYYCINGDSGCDEPRGAEAKYSILIFIPVGAAGGADLSIEHTFSGEPVIGTPFPLGITVKNNGGQQEDNTADNLLILTYSEPQLPVPASLPEGCEGELGLVMCTKEALAVDETYGYELPFEFSETKPVRFTSTVAAFENTNYNLQQPDDVYSNNIVEDRLTAVEGSGGGGSGDTDTDGDRVVDDSDNCPNTANPKQEDFDQDGKGDECDTDDDGDGVVDLEDAFPFDADETADTDGDEIGDNADTDDDNDGVLDVDDRFPKIALGALIDTDGDGAPDDCDEACQGTGMTADEDDDGDGIEDDSDTYPLVAIGALADTDGDGAPDDCDDVCQSSGMAADEDDDNDGVLDADDGFPLIALGDLTDTDADGFPDDCDDQCLEIGMIADADDDNDGVLDAEDAFPDDPEESSDFDLDGIGDNADDDDDNDDVLDVDDQFPEDSRGGLDDDADGMADEWEILYGLDPTDPADAESDVDSDGATALEEFIANTDPTRSELNIQKLDFDTPSELTAEEAATVSLIYTTSDDNAATDGIAFNLHYNASAVSTSLVENFVYFEFGAESLGAEEFADTGDLDGNSLTDVYRTFSWKDSTGSWPGEGELPLTLLELVVNPSPEAASLELGISSVQPAEGYTIQGGERSIPIEVPAVDSDGDGINDADDLFPDDARGGLDADGDGMADEWEVLVGLDPNDASDAESDTDDDGATALEEFVRDTDPAEPDLEEQRLTWNAPSFLVTDQAANIELVYDTSDNNAETDGLAFKLFYNSTVVGQAINEGFIFGESRVDRGASVEDSADEDDNPATDRYQLFEWTPSGAAWPGQGSLPLTLLSFSVTPSADVSSLELNIVPVSEATGYELIYESLSLKVGAVSLDIDGDGKAAPLTDGLLVIRYLFGFRGDSLISGAVAAGATRTTAEEIEPVIEALIP